MREHVKVSSFQSGTMVFNFANPDHTNTNRINKKKNRLWRSDMLIKIVKRRRMTHLASRQNDDESNSRRVNLMVKTHARHCCYYVIRSARNLNLKSNAESVLNVSRGFKQWNFTMTSLSHPPVYCFVIKPPIFHIRATTKAKQQQQNRLAANTYDTWPSSVLCNLLFPCVCVCGWIIG